MKNQKSYFLAGLIFGLILSVGLTAGLNMALAAWSEPSQSPPNGNVNPFTKTLANVLADGSDAGSFAGNVNIGSTSANLYVPGGEIKGKWFHSTATTGYNSLAGSLSVGKTTAPTSALDVNGETKTAKISTGDNTATNVLMGKVAVGKASVSTGATLDVGGEIWGTAFVYSSDRRLKKNIRDIESPLLKILALKGVVFDWISSGKTDIGLIAQEVEIIFPEAVKTDKATSLKAVEYGNLIAPLIEAIKEQQKQIEELKLRIEQLER